VTVALDVRPGAGPLPDGFAAVARAAWGDDPTWIPEEPAELAGAFSAHNPWFRAGQATLACAPGRARAAGFWTPAPVEGENAAFFGYFETTGDADAERAVLAHVAAWAREHGARRLYGPIDFATALRYRVLLAHEPGALPFHGEPWTRPGIPAALEALGFAIARRYKSVLIPEATRDAACDGDRPAYQRCLAEGYRIESLTPARWLAEADRLHPLVDDIFAGNFAYSPIARPQFDAMCGADFAARFDPEVSTIAYAPDGAIAGVYLIYPHYGPLLVQGAGAARVAAARIRFAEHFQALGKVAQVFKTLGVARAQRSRGVASALVFAGFERGRGRYQGSIAALMREDNRTVTMSPPGSHERWYGLYSKPI